MNPSTRSPHASARRLLPGVLLFLTVAAAPAASAVDFTVTKTTDTNDGVCGADCSLREAVVAANMTVAADRIILPTGQTFTLTLLPADADGTLVQGAGDLDVTAALTIEGNGSTIDANGIDRVLDIQGNFTVVLNSVNLTGGVASGFLSSGGGIRVRNSSLILNTSSVKSSATALEAGIRDDGGGIAVIGTYIAGAMTLARLTLNQSSVNGNTGGTGGGILCALCVLEVSGSSISNNVASGGDGGGIAILGDASTATVSRSVMINNSAAGAGRGGALAFAMGSSAGSLQYNRIMFNLAGTGRAIYNNTAIVTARNNWWGCSYGPGATGAGCAATMNDIVGTAASAPWLVLRLTASPGTIPLGATSTATADLSFNSAGENTSAGGTVADGASVAFSATGGTFATPTATMTSGKAADVYTATGPKGTATLSATLDQQSASTQIRIGYASFTDDPIAAGVTVIKAAHIAELRSRINAIRSARGLAAFAWTAPALTPQWTTVPAQHIIDLRTALGQAYSAAGVTQPVYTDSSLAPGMSIRALHIAQLRNAVVDLE